jgi:hypothetical protein
MKSTAWPKVVTQKPPLKSLSFLTRSHHLRTAYFTFWRRALDSRSITEEHGITIDTSRSDRPADSFAIPSARTVCIPPLRSAIGYATALHEFGHLIAPGAQDPSLEAEKIAWQWAREHALIWTPQMARLQEQALAYIVKKTCSD